MLYLKILFMHGFIALLMPIFKFDRVRRWTRALTPQHKTPPGIDHNQIADLVRKSSRWIPATSCLTEALCCYRALARLGFRPDLMIGLRREGSHDLEAHAWIEIDGQVVIGDNGQLDGYTRMGTERRNP